MNMIRNSKMSKDSHYAEYKDDYLVEKTKMDYTKADLKELQENQKVDYIG